MTRVIGQKRADQLWQRAKHFAYAPLTDAEYAVVKSAATKNGLTVADFVRRCVNHYLAALDEEGLLLEEQADYRGRHRKGRTASERRT